eukprot:106214_1
MVIFFAIGDYFDPPPENAELDAYCADLNGLELDIANLRGLFKEILNYQCYTFYYDNDPRYPKLSLEKKQILKFMKEKAKSLAYNIELKKCDGLVVVISGHGYEGNIITSDYGLIDKHHIHRIFSKYRITRNVPRIFVYDVCDGEGQMEATISDDEACDQLEEKLETENTKQVSEDGNMEQETTGKLVKITHIEMINFNDNDKIVKRKNREIPE